MSKNAGDDADDNHFRNDRVLVIMNAKYKQILILTQVKL